MGRPGFLGAASLALALLAAAPGCGKSRGHSQAFEEASALFRKVYAEKLDDAYDDPRMQEVERLLAVVPPQSIDAPAAQELQQRIAAGRAALRAGTAQEPAQEQPPEQPANPWARPEEEDRAYGPDAGEAPDAGAPHPEVGMAVEELRRRFADCFSYQQNIRFQEDNSRHDLYALVDTSACARAHPGFDKQFLVIDSAGKKITGFAPTSALETRYYYADGGQAPPPKK
ncbi:MAG TPA: hypothetical protein VFB81_09610 [Myxococcales bacterium]|nr:hypothetical protein [Myxococcales bacterium]